MLMLRLLIATGLLLAAPDVPNLAQVEQLLDPAAVSLADRLDIVSSGSMLSHVEYTEKPAMHPPTLAAPLPRFSLPLRLQRFGSITGTAAGYRVNGKKVAGVRIDLASAKWVRNLLPYQVIRLSGTWEGTWHVALADDQQVRSNEQTNLGPLVGSGTATVAIGATATANTDLTRARYLIFTLVSPTGRLKLKSVSLEQVEVPPLPTLNGVWILNSQRLIKQGAAIVEDLAERGLKRAYVQFEGDPGQLYPFLRAAAQKKIEVFAVEGSPEHLQIGTPLLARIATIIAYNRVYVEAPFTGVQVDLSLAGIKDFGVRRQHYSDHYLQLLQEISGLCRGVIPLSLMIPPWLAQVPTNGVNLLAKAIPQVDELVVSGNRTQLDELQRITSETMAWAEHFSKPVFVGIKAGTVPDEGHLQLKRSTNKLGDTLVALGGGTWEVVGRTTLTAGSISFAGQQSALESLLKTRLPASIFGGWVVNSYENLK